MSLLLFFVVLAVLVLSHEFGHFIVAKSFGIKVEEFGFGFPPKLFSVKKGETEYSFNAIPFGGFVKIFGEDENEEYDKGSDNDKKRSLLAKSKLVQSAVISAGVVFNFLLAWLLISTGLTIGTKVSVASLPDRLEAKEIKLIITDVLKDSPADKAGLQSGFEIISLSTASSSLQGENVSLENVQQFIASSKDKELFVWYRDEIKETSGSVSLIPVSGIVEDRGAVGVSLDNVGTLKLPFYRAFFEGGIITCRLVYAMIDGLINFIYGFFSGESSMDNVSGPVGMIQIVGEAGRRGISQLLNIVALISINLAVLNMVPFPALDGGRLFFIIAESISGRTINKKMLAALNAFSFLFLLAIMFLVTYGDIVKLLFK